MANEIPKPVVEAQLPPVGIAAPAPAPPAVIAAPVPVQITEPAQIGQNLAETVVAPVNLYNAEADKAARVQENLRVLNIVDPNAPEATKLQQAEEKAIADMGSANAANAAEIQNRQTDENHAYQMQKFQIEQKNKQLAAAGLPLLEVPADPAAAPAPTLTDADIQALPDFAKNAMATPSAAEVKAQLDKAFALPRAENAQKLAMNELAKEEKFMQDVQDERERKLDEQIKVIDDRVRQKSFSEIMQTGSLGQKLGAAFAVMASGAIAGGTGNKGNPVLEYMDKVTDQQADRDKLNQQEREALRANVYRQGELELKKLDGKSLNAFRKDQLNQQAQQLADARMNVEANLRASAAAAQPSDIFSGKPLKSPQEVLYAKTNMPERVATLPNGKVYVLSPENAKNIIKDTKTNFNALNIISKIRAIAKKGGKLSVKDQDDVQTNVQLLAAGLREPVLGPGTMQKEEYNRLLALIGSPLSWTSWTSREDNKLATLEARMKEANQQAATMYGVVDDIHGNAGKMYPVNVGGKQKLMSEAQLTEAYAKKYPDMSEQQRQQLLQKFTGQ